MKKWMCVLLSVLLCACTARGSSDGSRPAASSESSASADPEAEISRQADEMLLSMSLEDKLEQMILISAETWNGADFTSVNEEAQKLFSDYHFGGFVLFAQNLKDEEEAEKLVSSMQEINREAGGIPYIMAADQEGGYVTRTGFGTDTPGNMALAASGNPDNAEEAGRIIGEELCALGINTDFAPVMDVNSNPANPVIGIRSFSDDPDLVSTFGNAFRKGLERADVASCIKHFPGHGDTSADSHFGLPVCDQTLTELEQRELVPFQNAINDGADLVMIAHIQYPEVITQTAQDQNGETVSVPASLSREMVRDILRQKMGYEGLIVTDSLRMDAIAAHFGETQAAELAINAGVDILLMPFSCIDATCFGHIDSYVADLKSDVENGTIRPERIDESVHRILTWKIRHGLLDDTGKDDDMDAMAAHHKEESRKLASQCATVVENKGVLPLNKDDSILVCGMNDAQTNALQYGYNRLQNEGGVSGIIQGMNLDWGGNLQGVLNSLDGKDTVIACSWLDNLSQLDPGQSRMITALNELIHQAQSRGVKVIILSTGLPYDLSAYQDADALLAVYNPIGIDSFDINGRPLGCYGENIASAMDVLYGTVKNSAVLPVSIPGIHESSFSDEIVYERGFGIFQ